MKKKKIEVIERITDNFEPTYQLLPNLLNKREQEIIRGGGGEAVIHCGEEYSVKACFFLTSCQGSYSDDSSSCQRGYLLKEPCTSA